MSKTPTESNGRIRVRVYPTKSCFCPEILFVFLLVVLLLLFAPSADSLLANACPIYLRTALFYEPASTLRVGCWSGGGWKGTHITQWLEHLAPNVSKTVFWCFTCARGASKKKLRNRTVDRISFVVVLFVVVAAAAVASFSPSILLLSFACSDCLKK